MCGCGLDSAVSGRGRVAYSCEHDNEPSVTIKGEQLTSWSQLASQVRLFYEFSSSVTFRPGCFSVMHDNGDNYRVNEWLTASYVAAPVKHNILS
jgi:hypothetical protein